MKIVMKPIYFRGIIIGLFRDVQEEAKEYPKISNLVCDIEVVKLLTIGSHADWLSVKDMIVGWVETKPAPELVENTNMSDHDTIMKMSAV